MFGVADLFGVLGGLVGAGFLFGGGEGLLFGAGEAFVGGHAFEEKLAAETRMVAGGALFKLEGAEFIEEAWICWSSLRESAAENSSVRATVPPRLNHCSICWVLVSVKYWSENAGGGLADDLADDGVSTAHFAFVLEFDFAGDAGEGGEDVGDAGDGEGFVVQDRPALGIRDDEFHGGDGQALRDAGPLVDLLVVAGGEGDGFDDLRDVVGDVDL